MKPTHISLCLIAASAALTLSARSQAPMPSVTPLGWDASLTRLFGEIKAFSATADLQMLDKSGQETLSLGGISFALRDAKVRVELDMSRAKGARLPSAAVASLKEMGMDRVVSIVVPEKKVVIVICPGLQATVEMLLPESEMAALAKDAKLERSKLGEETIDGLPCVKSRVLMSDGKGQRREILVWSAPSLKDFPVRVRIPQDDNTIEMRFRQVKFEQPDARQFEPPADYTRHGNFQQFMMEIMQKIMADSLGME